METIDINKVAGLQALDSEGNVLGVVSMEQLTDMVAGKLATELAAQNTAPAMRTMSLTASPAAASVAATGVDKTEGQLSDVTDPGYVRVLDKSGNSGKQGIEQFAQVVEGLLGINDDTWMRGKGTLNTSNTSSDDVLKNLENGIYTTIGLSFTPYLYGTLVTFRSAKSYVGFQIFVSNNGHGLYMRQYWESWTEWKRASFI